MNRITRGVLSQGCKCLQLTFWHDLYASAHAETLENECLCFLTSATFCPSNALHGRAIKSTKMACDMSATSNASRSVRHELSDPRATDLETYKKRGGCQRSDWLYCNAWHTLLAIICDVYKRNFCLQLVGFPALNPRKCAVFFFAGSPRWQKASRCVLHFVLSVVMHDELVLCMWCYGVHDCFSYFFSKIMCSLLVGAYSIFCTWFSLSPNLLFFHADRRHQGACFTLLVLLSCMMSWLCTHDVTVLWILFIFQSFVFYSIVLVIICSFVSLSFPEIF